MNFDALCQFHCPRWDELPPLDLYLDQVLMVLCDSLRPIIPDESTAITSTMVNNYVKQKVVAPSIKKKYTRRHISQLMMVTLLKRTLSIAEVSTVLIDELQKRDMPEVYDAFCDELEMRLRGALTGTGSLSAPDTPFTAAVQALVGKIIFENIMFFKQAGAE